MPPTLGCIVLQFCCNFLVVLLAPKTVSKTVVLLAANAGVVLFHLNDIGRQYDLDKTR